MRGGGRKDVEVFGVVEGREEGGRWGEAAGWKIWFHAFHCYTQLFFRSLGWPVALRRSKESRSVGTIIKTGGGRRDQGDSFWGRHATTQPPTCCDYGSEPIFAGPSYAIISRKIKHTCWGSFEERMPFFSQLYLCNHIF